MTHPADALRVVVADDEALARHMLTTLLAREPGVTVVAECGNGPETMNRVSMIGNDLALDAGVGVCGKDGQSVPVGVGQPSLKIDAMTVGGTRA